MRIIPSELTAAQLDLSSQPATRVRAWERRFGVQTPAWESVYSDSADALPHNAAVLSDGAILRARMRNGGLDLCRITDPEDPDQWSDWESSGYTGDDGYRPAIAAAPGGGTVHLMWVGGISRNIRHMVSTDYGAIWSTPIQAISEPSGSQMTGLCAAMRAANSDVYLFYTVDPGGAGADDLLKVLVYSGGSWGSATSWSYGVRYAFCGIDVAWSGDFHLVVAGREASSPYDYRLWAVVYGDGGEYTAGTWHALEPVESSDNTDYRYQEPSLCHIDTARLSYLDRYAGTGGYRRATLSAHVPFASFGEPYWTEPAPFDYEPAADIGPLLRCRSGGTTLYIIGHDRTWSADLDAKKCDVSERVVAYTYREGPAGGSLILALDNSDGALADAGDDDSDYRSLRRGAELRIERGLRVGGTDYLAGLPACIVDSLEWHQAKGTDLLIVRCLDWWGILRRWRAGRLFQWDSDTPAAIGAELLARVGLDFASQSGEGSSEMGSLTAGFIVPPAQDGASALRRLTAIVPDALRFDGNSTVLYKELSDDETADYTAGGDGEHPPLEASFVEGTSAVNAMSIQGDGDIFGDALDCDEIGLVGVRRRIIGDAVYTTASEAAMRAEGDLAKSAVLARAGWLRLRPIHGLELWDVLGVTYPRGWAGVRKYRVAGIVERYSTRRARYEQVVRIAML